MAGSIMLITPRLVLRPVAIADLPDLIRLKADALVFGQMLDGVRAPWQAAQELAADIAAWGALGYGMFAVRDARGFHGIAGVQLRPDGRGPALRFAVWPEARGRGVAREAAGAALRYAQEAGNLRRVIAVARRDNFASRMVLGGIGMYDTETFRRDGHVMVVYESVAGVRLVGAHERRPSSKLPESVAHVAASGTLLGTPNL